MKKIKIILCLLIGGVILMTAASLNGCSLGGETIPKNRTKEQYEFEKTFEPLFKFLEQDKIDLTGIKSYSVSVSIGDRKTQKESYEIFLKSQNNPVNGFYTIRKDENKQEVPVRYENSQLVYLASVETEFVRSSLTCVLNESILNH